MEVSTWTIVLTVTAWMTDFLVVVLLCVILILFAQGVSHFKRIANSLDWIEKHTRPQRNQRE